MTFQRTVTLIIYFFRLVQLFAGAASTDTSDQAHAGESTVKLI
jgi:hypothetical protein